ncbi:MAG TPA: nuclear transport factor 2 family protein [Allosphingosinicella sp.]|nr:nuclear transport factor 2 family protein [Allosphingosinicella sp.]
MNVIAQWHEVVARKDPALLAALLADDVVFQSPAVHSPQEGKAITLKYLGAALVVLNNESFRYLDEWVLADKAVLEFESEVDGLIVNGVDMIWWDESGRITRFKVMVRPLKALNALVALMAAELTRAG